ncbi:MAG: DapH/DapD/GlmU-related protein [Chitinophagales bacterium]
MLRIIIKLISKHYQNIRIILFQCLSNNSNLEGNPIIKAPTLFFGKGKISFGKNVALGFFPSPYFYDGSIHIESRNSNSTIIFGSNIQTNNNLKIICDNSSIEISDDVLIGTNVEIIDSDFHEINPEFRNRGQHQTRPVFIGKNVFIGSNCKIMKGVSIGINSIIANGSIVLNDIPENVIAGGSPAKVIKNI